MCKKCDNTGYTYTQLGFLNGICNACGYYGAMLNKLSEKRDTGLTAYRMRSFGVVHAVKESINS